ncbi:MAG: hypothetical protein ACYSYV_02005 [Planctomycetota bacterium]
MKRFAVLLLVLVSCISAGWAITNEYSRRIVGLAEQILFTAEELVDATDAPVFDSPEAEEILAELKDLIKEYETVMVFAESPYAGEILLGTTPGGDSTWLETLCSTRYDGPLKEIRIRRTGHRARYLRINDIEITCVTPQGPQKATFNKSGRVRLYSGGVFRLALPRPMRVRRIRININHESTGLEVTGIPYDVHIVQPSAHRRIGRVEGTRYPAEVLLGTTPGGDGTWLETLCSNPYNRPVREIRLERTGRKASYLRINDIEVTYLAPGGPRRMVFNKNGRFKLRYDDVYRLSLPRPMRIAKIRIRADHESTGLKVYGVL